MYRKNIQTYNGTGLAQAGKLGQRKAVTRSRMLSVGGKINNNT